MRRRPLIAVLSSLLTLSFLLSACGDDDSGHSMEGMSDGASDMPSDDHSMGDRHDERTPVADGARRIPITGTSFAFDPDEITVEVGEDVALVLTSDDILHDLNVEGLDAHVVAAAGETAEGGLRADEAGEYAFYCSVEGHREAGMEGTLIVEEAS